MVLSAPSESVKMMAQDRMGDLMAAIVPVALAKRQAAS
jgi:hypothetical protein